MRKQEQRAKSKEQRARVDGNVPLSGAELFDSSTSSLSRSCFSLSRSCFFSSRSCFFSSLSDAASAAAICASTAVICCSTFWISASTLSSGVICDAMICDPRRPATRVVSAREH
jgi:hypothetical protein